MGEINDARKILAYLKYGFMIVMAVSFIQLYYGMWKDSLTDIFHGIVMMIIASILGVVYGHYKEMAGIDENYYHG